MVTGGVPLPLLPKREGGRSSPLVEKKISGDLSSLTIDLHWVAGRVLGGNPFLLP